MTDTGQTTIDPFREMNRYDERDEDYPSDTVYEPPRRTMGNGWAKFHAARDCGARNVAFVEDTNSRMVGSDRWDYDLRCWSCGHAVDEDEVLFIGGDWYNQHGILALAKSIDDLHLPEDRVLDLGPDPDQDELRHALELTRIERQASIHGVSFGNERYYECGDCGKETFLLFDDRCRMCYDGEWTDRMQETLQTLDNQIRVRNNSFVHRVEQEIDPLATTGIVGENAILWRRHDAEGTSKIVEVTQRLEDYDDGHMEYVLWNPTHTDRWQYREEDLADCFWATGLYNEETKPVQDDRIRDLWERVREK